MYLTRHAMVHEQGVHVKDVRGCAFYGRRMASINV